MKTICTLIHWALQGFAGYCTIRAAMATQGGFAGFAGLPL
jgi:hypothetical protein